MRRRLDCEPAPRPLPDAIHGRRLELSVGVAATIVTRVTSWTLRQDDKQRDDDGRNYRRGKRSAQGETPVGDGLVNEVPHGCTKRSRQDEGDPKQGGA